MKQSAAFNRPHKVSRMAKDNNNRNLAFATMLWVQAQSRKLSLQLKGVNTESYQLWSINFLNSLQEIYKLNDDDQEWLSEMAMMDQTILDALFLKVLNAIPELEGDNNFNQVSDIIAELLELFVFKNGKVYDSRLRNIFRMLCLSLLNKNKRGKKQATMLLSMAEMKAVENATKFVHEMEVVRVYSLIRMKMKQLITKSGLKLVLLQSVVGYWLVYLEVYLLIGLAAPAIAAGLINMGVVSAGALGTGLAVMSSVAGSAIIGSVLGVTGAGIAGYKYNKRQKDVQEFEFIPINKTEIASMSYMIAIPGWLPTLDAGREQWAPIVSVNPLTELYLLSFERATMVELTLAATTLLRDNIVSYGASTAAALSSAAGLAFALSFPIAAIRATAMIDNPWMQCLKKSEQAGILLARSVISQYVGGKRPVSLVGHGNGARVIYFCLLELYNMREEIDVYSMVDNVYLLGATIAPSKQDWLSIIPLVSGRFVNCFSNNDWFLKILFRLSMSPCAGSSFIEIPGVENVDVTYIINSHPEYTEKREEILKAIGFENVL